MIKKVVIWGLKPESHTHSYIHSSFYKAFKHLNYEVYWFPDEEKKEFNFSNTLFITCGISDTYIPIRQDCFYILHNCTNTKYKQLYQQKRCITIQVSTTNIYGPNSENLINANITYKTDNPCIFAIGEALYVHWMTDLLPYEIDENINTLIEYTNREKKAGWVGTINDCPRFGNKNEIAPFEKACKNNNIKFEAHGMYLDKNLSGSEAIKLIKNSYLAPAINGHWQRDVGYIPCRIFKNISYGHISGTNNKRVYELFNKMIPYDIDTDKLFYKMNNANNDKCAKENTIKLMELVRDKFTYINLINYIINFFKYHNSEFSF